MENINEALILKLEKLAYLSLSDEERQLIKSDLNNILKMIDQLQTVDTNGVEPLRFINNQVNVMREDNPQVTMTTQEALSNVKNAKDGFFVLPKIINKNG